MSKENLDLFKKVSTTCSEKTLKHYLFNTGYKKPEQTALEWLNKDTGNIEGVTYAEFLSEIIALGTALYAHGFKGKKVAVIGAKSYEWVLIFMTSVCSDICVIPLDADDNPNELFEKLDFCKPDYCFASSFVDDSVRNFAVSSANADTSLVGKGAGSVGKGAEKPRIIPFSEISQFVEEGQKALLPGNDSWISDFTSDTQICMMMFTSGTGGKRKLAILNQMSMTLERDVWLGLGMDKSKNKYLVTLPLFHIAGLCELRACLMIGLTVYLSSGIKYLLDEYAYVKPEIAFMVPAQAMLLNGVIAGKPKQKARELLGGNLNTIRTSAAPLPEKIKEMFNSYDIEVTSDYGMTETCGPVSVSYKKDGKIFTKPGSVGRVLDILKVYPENPDENGCGEIVIEGPCVFDGYYNDEEETSSILENGKLYTGDIGYVDDDNFLFLVGRKKNLIILSNGENIIPEELEQRVYQIPEVKECVVYAKNDVLAVKIYSDTCDDEQYLINEVKKLNEGYPNRKVLRIIHVEKNPLPKTSTGKILRSQI